MNASARATGQALLAAAALVLVSACGAGEGDTAPPATDEPPASTTATTATPQQQAGGDTGSKAENTGKPAAPEQLRFTAQTLDGETFHGASLAGSPAVLWFWAPWCPNCQREAPTIADAEAKHGDAVTFVGVAARDDVPAMQDFTSQYGIDGFTNLNDANAAIWTRFGVTYQPAFAFIGANGSVDVVKGSLSAEELDARLSALAG